MADSPTMSWSPEVSRYPTSREKKMASSKLTLDGRTLSWFPVGLVSPVVSKPFGISLGRGQGDASEIIWVRGILAHGQYQPVKVDLVAVCARGEDAEGHRHVLGYLPTRLFEPWDGQFFEHSDREAAVSERLAAFAAELGLSFEVYDAPYGQNVNAVFPGAMPGASPVPLATRIVSLMLVAGGIVIAANVLGGNESMAFRVLALTVAALMVIVGIVSWPAGARFRRPTRV